MSDRRGDFLPDLCGVHAVFFLVLVGELLAVGLVVADSGVVPFDWAHLGLVSLLIQWVVLSSAACLCPLRPWFRRRNPFVSGLASYSIVLLIAAIFSGFGSWLLAGSAKVDYVLVFNNTVIAAVFAGIVLRYFYLQQQLLNQQQAELKARLQSLQSRIRPHFLFNSLNTIAYLIDEEPKTAEKMVLDLADLFRVSLNESGLVSLEDEIALSKRFIDMEKLRLADRLSVVWRTSDIGIPFCRISTPSLLLQPLIENAIYHGVQPLAEGGEVSVDITTTDNQVHIRIENPLAPKQLHVSGKEHRGNGIALENIVHRLNAFFEKQTRVTVERGEERFVVNVHYPLVEVDKSS